MPSRSLLVALVLLTGCNQSELRDLRAEVTSLGAKLTQTQEKVSSLEVQLAQQQATLAEYKTRLAAAEALALRLQSSAASAASATPEAPGAPAATPPTTAAMTGTSEPDHRTIFKEVGPGRYTISRAEADRLLDGQVLARQARVVPARHDGRVSGFRLFGMRPWSAFRAVGLQNGDEVQTLNGIEQTSPERALEAYSKIRRERRLVLTGVRRGQPLRIEVVVK